MACSQKLRTEEPINFILFGLITLCESFAVSYGKIFGIEPAILIFITSGIVIGLAIFAMQTKIDFALARNRLLFSIVLCIVMTYITFTLYPSLFADNRWDNKGQRDDVVVFGIAAFALSFLIFFDTQAVIFFVNFFFIILYQLIFSFFFQLI